MPKIDRETLRPRLNLYEVLQISSTASPDVVQAAYRALARLYHPDVNPSPNAARMMRQLNAAYAVLSDPERRSRYDAYRTPVLRVRPSGRNVVQPTKNDAPVGPDSAAASAPRRTNPTRAVGGVRRPVVLPVVPVRTTWRVGRLVGLLLVLVLMMGALGFAFWLTVSWLEEEPLGPMRAASMYVGPHLTFLS